MDFTVESRKNKLVHFMSDMTHWYSATHKDGSYIYGHILDMFRKRYIAKGAEGSVFSARFKRPIEYDVPVAIKVVNLRAIRDDKGILSSTIRFSTLGFYRAFYTEEIAKRPSTIEFISQTLSNQLVFQGICPHFVVNYYWDYINTTKELIGFNEFVDGGLFKTWMFQNHTPTMWLNALFQIFVGILALQRYYGMIHSDLHSSNVLLKRVAPGGYWRYSIDGKDYYVPNMGYICIINDFGFSWVPDKLGVDWHVEQTLQHLTRNGRAYYDVHKFVKDIKQIHDKYNVIPTPVLDVINSTFAVEEIDIIFTHSYYTSVYKGPYPNVDAKYNGLGTTLADKIPRMFYDMYSSKPRGDTIELDHYSLNKQLDKTKFPTNLVSYVKRVKKPKK